MKVIDVNLAFDPVLVPIFPNASDKTNKLVVKDSRDLFYALIHVSDHYDALSIAYHYLKLHFQHAREQCAESFLGWSERDQLPGATETQSANTFDPENIDKLLKNESLKASYEVFETSLNDCLVQFAPLFFTELAWLPPIFQTVSCQSPLVVDLMGMYGRFNRGGHNRANSRATYQGYLLAVGIEIPDLDTLAFSKQPAVGEEMFDFGAIQLALAQFPRVFFPEILGFTLAYCHSAGLSEQLLSNSKSHQLPDFIVLRDQRRKLELPTIKSIILSFLAEYRGQGNALWQRIQTGFWSYQLQTDYCVQRINVQLQTVLSPRQAMHKLLQSLLPHAIGHHGNIRLGSKTIDEWFKEVPFKGDNFLATLLHSPLVDRSKPENSKLLKLYGFRGPMFGVLDEKGLDIVKNWLRSEVDPSKAHPKKNPLSPLRSRGYSYGLKKMPNEPERIKGFFEGLQPNSAPMDRENYGKLSNKALFYYLINSDLFPEVLTVAKHRAARVLFKAGLFSRLPFRHYAHEAFESYIKSLYQKEVARYKPLNRKPKLSREAYAWGIEQFAPTILTDGSWLQGVHLLAAYPTHAIGDLLAKIYADEIGNGIRAQNHPFIYQELLDSLNIALPPIASKEFTLHSGFIAGAFDIPVYFMSIAKFPCAFLPELLGLNMAIELSGLGNLYLRLSQALQYWGINAAIVDIHTSIDNLASGHSAMAMQAIQLYLDGIASCSGQAAVDAHWRRIYTGYCSLQSVSNRFKFSLIGHYFLNRPVADNNNK